jgi:hypothetical protein
MSKALTEILTPVRCGCGATPTVETAGTCVDLSCSCGMSVSLQICDILDEVMTREERDLVKYDFSQYAGYEPRVQQLARDRIIAIWNSPRSREAELLAEIEELKAALSTSNNETTGKYPLVTTEHSSTIEYIINNCSMDGLVEFRDVLNSAAATVASAHGVDLDDNVHLLCEGVRFVGERPESVSLAAQAFVERLAEYGDSLELLTDD